MPVYKLFGTDIEISQAKINYSSMLQRLIRNITISVNSFKKNYSQNYPSQQNYSSETINYALDALRIAADDYASLLRANKIYTISPDEFLSEKYITGVFSAVVDIVDTINGIHDSAQAEKDYRAQRKANRSRAVGGGFGVPAYIKASVDAAAINAATGLGHSVMNAIGNAGTSIVAEANIRSIISSSNTIGCISDEISAAIEKMHSDMLSYLSDEAGVKFEYIMEAEANKADNILQQIDAIPAKDRPNALLQAMKYNYLNEDIYTYIVRHYPSESRAADNIASALHLDASGPIKDRINVSLYNLFKKKDALSVTFFTPLALVKSIYDDFKEVEKSVQDTGWSEDLIEQRIPAFNRLKEKVNNLEHDYLGYDFNDRKEFLTCLDEIEAFYRDMQPYALDDDVVFAECRLLFDKYEILNLYHYDFLEYRLFFLRNLKCNKIVNEFDRILFDRDFSEFFELREFASKFEAHEAQIEKYVPLFEDEQMLLIVCPVSKRAGIAFTTERIIIFDLFLGKRHCFSKISKTDNFSLSNARLRILGPEVEGTPDLEIDTGIKDSEQAEEFITVLNSFVELLKYRFPESHIFKNEEKKAEETTNKDTKFCTHCGKKIPRSSKFCTFCGEQTNYGRE